MGGNRYDSRSDGHWNGKGGMRPKSSRMGLKLSFQKERDTRKGGGKGKSFDFRKGKGGKGHKRYDSRTHVGKSDFRDGGKNREFNDWDGGKNDFRKGEGKGKGGDRQKGGGKGKRSDGESGNPFVGRGNGESIGPTGPMLGKGSELRKVHTIHARTNLGHWDAVEALTMFNEKFVSASSDETAIIWKGDSGGPNGLSLIKDNELKFKCGCRSLYFEPGAQMLFCGLANGEIKCFQAQPLRDMLLVGHQKAVTCQTSQRNRNGDGVLITGSEDATIRFWEFNTAASCFNCTFQVDSHCGAVSSLQVVGESLWVGGERGICCLLLENLELAGRIECKSPLSGPLLIFEGHVVASFRDGSVAIYDLQGNEHYFQKPQGEHQSNTASTLMMHPCGVPLIMCGQKDGYVTAYELPSFAARGSFRGVDGSDVTSILDLGIDGMFVVGGRYGDVTAWQWGKPGMM